MGWTREGSMTCFPVLLLGKSHLNCKRTHVLFQCKLKTDKSIHIYQVYPYLYFIFHHPGTGSCSPRRRKHRRSWWWRSPWSRWRSLSSASSSWPQSARRSSSRRRSIGRVRCLWSAAGCRGWQRSRYELRICRSPVIWILWPLWSSTGWCRVLSQTRSSSRGRSWTAAWWWSGSCSHWWPGSGGLSPTAAIGGQLCQPGSCSPKYCLIVKIF